MASLEQVMTSLGGAVFAAQNFEINVGTLLLFLTVEKGDRAPFQDAEGNADENSVKAFLVEVDQLTLGQLKGKLEGLGVLSNEAIDQITSLNQTRRRLIHYFVPDYHDRMGTEDGRQEVLEELNAMEEKFRNAWYGLQNFLAAKALERGYNA